MTYEAYNICSRAAVHQNRKLLAHGLRLARKHGPRDYARRCFQHASYVGWPVRKRPNGRFH